MFAVVFEVQPKQECWDTYLALAKQLKPKLEQIEGFIDNERFASTRTEGRVLSLSTWQDEKALIRWRTHGEHHQVQEKGRFEVFADYHLRVGEITRDSREPQRAAFDEQTRPIGRLPDAAAATCAHRRDATETGAAKALTLTEVTSLPDLTPEVLADTLGLKPTLAGLVDHEVFSSIYTQGKLLLLASWTSANDAQSFAPHSTDRLQDFRHRTITVIRDYGMRDRREAPQYYPAVDA